MRYPRAFLLLKSLLTKSLFLAIEYAHIISPEKRVELSFGTTTQANASMLNSTIVEPLLQWYGIDGFREGVIDAQDKVGQGMLRNVREVEVALKVVAKVSLCIL